MKRFKMLLPVFFVLIMSILSSCKKYAVSDEINGLIRTNDLSLSMKTREPIIR